MKCIKCPACIKTSYEYAEYDCYAGVPDEETCEFPDGTYGCRLHYKTIQKRINDHDKSYYISMANAMELLDPDGYEKTLKRADSKRHIEDAAHCIGLDYKNPYTRHGKKFYKPYRNYYRTVYSDKNWADLRFLGFAVCERDFSKDDNQLVDYHLNDDGKKWLAEKLGIYKIW